MVTDLRNRPRGVVQRSYPTGDGRTMWTIHWQKGTGPASIASDLKLETGQAVFLTADGQLARVR